MKRALLGLLIGCLTLAFASTAMAGQNANAGFSFHVSKTLIPAKTGDPCGADAPSDLGKDLVFGNEKWRTKSHSCTGDKTGTFDVWLLVCGASDSTGVAGVEYGLEYDYLSGSGIDIQTWISCTDLEFPNPGFPFVPGTGNVQTWDRFSNCQTTGIPESNNPNAETIENSAYSVVGYLRVNVNGQDELVVGPRPVTGALKVADCESLEDDITGNMDARGRASFCGKAPGFNPCRSQFLATEPTTWGNIKTLYGEDEN